MSKICRGVKCTENQHVLLYRNCAPQSFWVFLRAMFYWAHWLISRNGLLLEQSKYVSCFLLPDETCNVHKLHVDIIFFPSVQSRIFLFKEMERSSIYFGAEYVLDNSYWYTERFVLAGYLTDGTSSSQSIKMPLNQ